MSMSHPTSSSKIILIAVLAVAFGPALAEAQLKLLVNKDDSVGRFVIEGDVAYDTATGVVGMDVFSGKDGAGADNPLFCFDFSTEEQAVTLDIDSNARVLAKGLKLTSALQYQLSAQTIAVTPSDDVACFFRAYDATNEALGADFGLYGQAPSAISNDNNIVFADDFSANPNLDVALSGFQASANEMVYQITVTNNSPFKLDSMAFQQSLPAGISVAEIDVICRVSGAVNEAVCATARKDTLRYEGFALDAGESLELSVTATGTTQLTVYAAVATPKFGGVAFDVDELVIKPL